MSRPFWHALVALLAMLLAGIGSLILMRAITTNATLQIIITLVVGNLAWWIALVILGRPKQYAGRIVTATDAQRHIYRKIAEHLGED